MHNFYVIGHRGVAGEKFEPSQALELKNAGIDGIFTNYPAKLLYLRA